MPHTEIPAARSALVGHPDTDDTAAAVRIIAAVSRVLTPLAIAGGLWIIARGLYAVATGAL